MTTYDSTVVTGLLLFLVAFSGINQILATSNVGFSTSLWSHQRNVAELWRRENGTLYAIISGPSGILTRHEISTQRESNWCQMSKLYKSAQDVDKIELGLPLSQVPTQPNLTKYNTSISSVLRQNSDLLVRDVFQINESNLNMVIVSLDAGERVLVAWRIVTPKQKDLLIGMWLSRNTSIDDLGSILRYQRQSGAKFLVKLRTRFGRKPQPLYGEDVRIFQMSNGSLIAMLCASRNEFAQIMYAPLTIENQVNGSKIQIYVEGPLRRVSMDKELRPKHQKNWPMLDYKGTLLFVQNIQPLRVIIPRGAPSRDFGENQSGNGNTRTELWYGETVSLTYATDFCWPWGEVRGGTPLVLVKGEYLGFFHTVTKMHASYISTYVMGAYTVSSEPPFRVTSMSRDPIMPSALMRGKWAWKRVDWVMFPMAMEYEASTDRLYVSLGRNDREGWIAVFDLPKLKASMRSLSSEVMGSAKWDDRIEGGGEKGARTPMSLENTFTMQHSYNK
jgi:hypothetical protein